MATIVSYLTTLPFIGGEATEQAGIEDYIASLLPFEPLTSVQPLADYDFGLGEVIDRITSGSDEDDSNATSGAFQDMFDLFSNLTDAPAIHTDAGGNAGGDLLAALLGADIFEFVSGPTTAGDLTSNGSAEFSVLDLLGDDIPSGGIANSEAEDLAQADSTSDDVKIGELDAFDFLF